MVQGSYREVCTALTSFRRLFQLHIVTAPLETSSHHSSEGGSDGDNERERLLSCLLGYKGTRIWEVVINT